VSPNEAYERGREGRPRCRSGSARCVQAATSTRTCRASRAATHQVLADNPAIAAGSQEGVRRAEEVLLGKMLEEMKRAGVKGAEHIEPNDLHVSTACGTTGKHPRGHRGATARPQAARARRQSRSSARPSVIERMRKSPGNAALTDAEQLLAEEGQGLPRHVRASSTTPRCARFSSHGRDMGTLRRELEVAGRERPATSTTSSTSCLRSAPRTATRAAPRSSSSASRSTRTRASRPRRAKLRVSDLLRERLARAGRRVREHPRRPRRPRQARHRQHRPHGQRS
jgi:hypothetical protein